MARAIAKIPENYHEGKDDPEKDNVVPLSPSDTKRKVKAYVERIKEANKLVEDARSNKSIVMKEAIGAGLDRKILNKIIKIEGMSPSEIKTENELLKLYAEAIGYQLELPLN